MEPHDDHEDAFGVGADKAFSIDHYAPPVRNAKQQKELDQKKLLAHYPALYPGEPEEYRLRRMEAERTCWEALSSRMQVSPCLVQAGHAAVRPRLPTRRRLHYQGTLPRRGIASSGPAGEEMNQIRTLARRRRWPAPTCTCSRSCSPLRAPATGRPRRRRS
jgi:hypothetical protein